MPDERDIEGGIEGWTEYRRLILAELERLSNQVTRVETKLDDFRTDELHKLRQEFSDRLQVVNKECGEKIQAVKDDVIALKVKAGVAGFFAGLGGSTLVGVILYFLTKH